MFLSEMYNSLEVNLRKGYRDFFIWIFTLMPFLKYYSGAYLACPSCNQVFLKNMVIFFFLYSFTMIILILGHVMSFMMNYKKPVDSIVDSGDEPYDVYARENYIKKKY